MFNTAGLLRRMYQQRKGRSLQEEGGLFPWRGGEKQTLRPAFQGTGESTAQNLIACLLQRIEEMPQINGEESGCLKMYRSVLLADI